eukprot:10814821-Alexandrium_andersonii.AAC.1
MRQVLTEQSSWDKFGHGDKEAIEKAVQGTMDLIGNQLVGEDQLKAKQAEMQAIANPIMAKLFQAAAE